MQWLLMAMMNLSVISIGGGIDNARTLIRKELSDVIVMYSMI